MLDHIITRVTGQPWATFLAKELLRPLGLEGITGDLRGSRLTGRAAVRYAPNREPIEYYENDTPGAASCWASAHDLLRFGLFHCSKYEGPLSPATRASMQFPTAETGDDTIPGYGVGWMVIPTS